MTDMDRAFEDYVNGNISDVKAALKRCTKIEVIDFYMKGRGFYGPREMADITKRLLQ